KAISTSKHEVSRWFNGDPNWTINTIASIAHALNVDVRIQAVDRSNRQVFTPAGLVDTADDAARGAVVSGKPTQTSEPIQTSNPIQNSKPIQTSKPIQISEPFQPSEKIKRLHHLSAEVRTLAADMRHQESRSSLLKIALAYDELAIILGRLETR